MSILITACSSCRVDVPSVSPSDAVRDAAVRLYPEKPAQNLASTKLLAAG